jgi:hypothetical protein
MDKKVELLVLTDTSKMPFGRYKGIEMANVPSVYLMWFYENADRNNLNTENKAVLEYIKDVLPIIEKEAHDAGH